LGVTTYGGNRRLDGAAGVIGIVLFLVGFLIPGEPPKADDSVQEITNYLTDNRGAILAGAFLIGLALAFFVWFAAGLARHLQASGDDSGLPRAAFGGAVVGATLTVAGLGVFAGGTFEAAKLGNQALNRFIYDGGNDIIVLGGAGFGLFLLAIALSAARTRALPGWTVAFGELAALLQFVSLTAVFADSGFFANGGAFAIIAFLSASIWVIAVGLWLIVRADRPAPASTAAVP
jgi:hypothetical protein